MNDHNFFYAEETAEDYDELVSLTSESYSQAHQVYRRILQRVLAPLLVDYDANLTILDLGCGTGFGAAEILKVYPDVGYVGFDISAQMIEIARRKIRFETGSVRNSVQFYRGDARNRDDLVRAASLCGVRQCLVISAFMFHHMTPVEKQVAYNAIFEIVAQGGFFLNLDLFDYMEPTVSEFAFQEECDWIVKSFAREQERTGRPHLEEKCKKWVHHVTNENLPLPISADTEIGGGITESRLLHKAGFRSVSTPFRHFQTGVVLSIRGES